MGARSIPNRSASVSRAVLCYDHSQQQRLTSWGHTYQALLSEAPFRAAYITPGGSRRCLRIMLARWVAEATGTVWQRDERVLCCAQVSQEAAELRGSLRFIACLFKEHLLPITFIHTLVLDFLGHVQACSLPSPCSISVICSDAVGRCWEKQECYSGKIMDSMPADSLRSRRSSRELCSSDQHCTNTQRSCMHNPLSIAR